MNWSKRNQWIMGVALVVCVIGLVVPRLFYSAKSVGAAGGEQWRAESDTLVQRVEKLAVAGEMDAAASVLEAVLQRGDLLATGQGDRARMALAQAYLAGGRRDQALAQVMAIPWADKGPQIAAEIVGMELAVRWRGLFDEQLDLVSGALTPQNSREAPFGRTDGLWQDRWVQYRALASALDRGARMVKAEGGQVMMPGTPALLSLARYSRGDGTLATLMTALGATSQWSPDLALSVMRLHLSEHEMEQAFAAAEVLWTHHADSTQAGLAFRELRLWQLRRKAMEMTIKLWSYPLFEQRLDELAKKLVDLATSAAVAARQERELNQAAMAAGMKAVESMKMDRSIDLKVDVSNDVNAPDFVNDESPDVLTPNDKPKEWKLAKEYDGIWLRVEAREVAAGSPVQIHFASEHRGEHQVRVYRIDGRKNWDALNEFPRRESLPTTAVAEQTVEMNEWQSIGIRIDKRVSFPDLKEGFYVVTVSARGCPVVIMSGVTVVDPDLHLIAGRTELLAWVVRRATGQGKVGEPIRATVTLERNTERAAGSAWAAADPEWRSGFIEGFTGTPSPDYKRADQQVLFAQGVTVGKSAATADPALSVELSGVSGADGMLRLPLPERLRGRAYHVQAQIDRADVAVVRTASFGEDAAWTSKAVVWADKPCARPGETLRYKVLLRDFNGNGYRLPVGELRTRLKLGDAELSDLTLAISDHGTLSGAVLIPPGATDGNVTLTLGDGSPHHVAKVERVRLPPVRYELIGLDAGLQIRAGESVPLTIRLRDRGGEPLAGMVVQLALKAQANSAQLPCEAVPPLTSDLAGEVHFSIPTSEGVEADYQADISFIYDHVTYRAAHEWRTCTFPFLLEATLRERDLRVGNVAQVELRLPVGAEVSVQFTRDGVALGKSVLAKGRSPAWTQVALGIDNVHIGANALTISTAVLGGKTASRTLALSVQDKLASDAAAKVAIIPLRNRVETGEALSLALGVSDPGRDVFVLGGARDVVFARVERMEKSSQKAEVTIAATWAPNVFLSGIAYLPGQGFVVSDRREVEVLPIDRLLTVTVTPSRADLRPGEVVEAAVQVVDWRGLPAADCSLSLGVVNDLLYQLAEDPTPDLWRYFHSYHRPWGLVESQTDTMNFPHGKLWRSVISRWQDVDDGMNDNERRIFGRHRSVSRGCGSLRSALMERALLQPETDSAIWWVADLKTDALGKAVVRFPLPQHAGRFRCTARANDASTAVLVGEVRSMIASREPYFCSLDLPDVVAAGDVVPAQIQVANYEDQTQTVVLTLPDGATRELVLNAKSRRTQTVPVTIPAGVIASGEVMRLGNVLGERLTLRISLATPTVGARVVTASATTLRRLPGLPINRQLQVVADADGVVQLPMVIQPDAGVWLRLRAWPDGATRRATALAEWRQRAVGDHPTLPAMGWLLSEPGAERRKQIAAWWPKLSDDAAAIVVKQAAIRRGEATIGINHVPTDALGDWLLARGRAAGQSLPSPRMRGIVGATIVERAASAATAVAEGWGEGRALWQGVARELLESNSATVDVVAIAIGCDAARLADDHANGQRLAALLAQREWNDELTAVLAGELLPEKSTARVNQVTLSSGIVGSTEVVLPASEYAEWAGVVGADMRLRTVPGALVQLDLLVQQPTHKFVESAVNVDLWQDVGDGYERIPEGRPIGPGRRLLLVIDNTNDHVRDMTVALPSLLRIGQAKGEVFLIDHRQDHWIFPIAEYETAMSHVADGDRQATMAIFAATLGRMTPVRSPIGRRLSLTIDSSKEAVIHGGGLISATVMSGQCLVFPIETLGEGTCLWPGTKIDQWQLADRILRIAAVDQPAPTSIMTGHPRLKELVAIATRGTMNELSWLVSSSAGRNDLASWDRALRILDPQATQSLDELIEHPELATKGHWTQKKIRCWVDSEPLMAADALLIQVIIGTEEPTLTSLIELAVTSRELRKKAWHALPQPQPISALPLVNLKGWYDRLRQLQLIKTNDYRGWCWEQELNPDMLARLDYAHTLDAWVAFARQQLELPLRIGAGVRTGNTVSTWVTLAHADHTGQIQQRESRSDPGFGGGNLGSSSLHDGLVVVALIDAYEVRPFLPSPQPRSTELSLDYTDVPATAALAHLNVLRANRGLVPVRLSSAFSVDECALLPAVTLRLSDVSADLAVELLAKIIDLKLVRERSEIRLERRE